MGKATEKGTIHRGKFSEETGPTYGMRAQNAEVRYLPVHGKPLLPPLLLRLSLASVANPVQKLAWPQICTTVTHARKIMSDSEI